MSFGTVHFCGSDDTIFPTQITFFVNFKGIISKEAKSYIAMVTNAAIKHSFYRAFLFQALPVTSAIYIVQLAENVLELRLYNDRVLNEEERDTCYSVAREMAGDFIRVEVNVNLLVSTGPFLEGDKAMLVYARYEYLS